MKPKFVLCIALGILFASCNKEEKTVGYYVSKGEEAISTLIKKEGFEILHAFPENNLFAKNQFVLLDNGCYLNIVDSGNGNRAVAGETVISMRCGLTFMSAKDDVPFSKAVDYSKQPVRFVYNDSYYSSVNTADENNPEHIVLSSGVESALKFVSENAVVRMIVPPLHMNGYGYANMTGSIYQNISLSPIYYTEILFEFASDH
ncbi:MAG: DUF4827 domain-containing protein [Tannerella sp.]|jgi:hypothetical protein|nr:DUF4827 domain-containing protein [Tannerella sp.]